MLRYAKSYRGKRADSKWDRSLETNIVEEPGSLGRKRGGTKTGQTRLGRRRGGELYSFKWECRVGVSGGAWCKPYRQGRRRGTLRLKGREANADARALFIG